MTYSELLNSPDWRLKRLEVLKRDKCVCQNCSNTKIEAFIQSYGRLDRRSTNSKRLIYKIFENQETSIAIDTFKSYNQILKNLMLYLDKIQDNYFVPIAARRLKKGEINSVEVDIMTNEWIFVNNLHIHHKYYIKDKLPWEYNTDALQTLCWSCHEELHKNVKIPIYLNNEVCGYLTPCLRCFGAGQFPEFNYIQSGVCFRCNGAKYEELIGH
jgi:5-methylcytosine-specific restriction endonuclease McrA